MSEKSFKIVKRNYSWDGKLRSIYRVSQDIVVPKNKDKCAVPRWACYLAIIAGVAIGIFITAALVVVVNAPRQALYSEDCSHRSCMKGLSMECKDSKCQCSTGYYYSNKCEEKKNYGEKCGSTSHCKSNLNLYCLDGKCHCNSTQYWTGSTCSAKGTNGASCKVDDACLTNTMLYCETRTSKCSCGSLRYWDGVACIPKRTINEPCSSDSNCLDTRALKCIGSTCLCITRTLYWDTTSLLCRTRIQENQTCSYTDQCYSPMTCTVSKWCQCGTREYHDLSALTCNSQQTYSGACTVDFNCRVDLYLSCVGGTCGCASPYVWSVGFNKCIIPGLYNTQCFVDTDCDSSKSLFCNTGTNNCTCPLTLSAGRCDCVRQLTNENFWDGSQCTAAKSYNDFCTNASTTYMCRTMAQGTVCSFSLLFKCLCPTRQYFDYTTTNKCFAQVLNGGSCPQGDECRTDLGLSCQSGTCYCDTTIQYWNGSQCVNLLGYNQGTCTNSNQCKSPLICQLSGNSCDCPTNVNTGKCDCPRPVLGAEYYWDSSSSTCVPAHNYSIGCSNDYQCLQIEQNTQCRNSICQCDQWEGFKNNYCTACQNNWRLYGEKCYRRRTSTQINQNTQDPSSSTVRNACDGTPIANSKLAALNSTLFSTLRSDGMFDNNGDKFYIDGYLSGSDYKSIDGTVTYTSFCNSNDGNCLVVQENGGSTCIRRIDCSDTENVFCEYPFF